MIVEERIRRYKYLPFNAGSLSIIKDGTMKFSHPTKVNDPFDCAPDLQADDIKKYIDSRPDLLKKVRNYLKLSKNELKKKKSSMVAQIELVVKDGTFGRGLIDNVGICSLSRDPLNLLMWAHYAQHHTGFVIEFDIPVTISTEETHLSQEYIFELLVPHEVQYQKNKPLVSFFDDAEEKRRKYFLIKGHDWCYEQEERVIDYVRGQGIHPYDRSILNSVIVGMKMDNDNYNTVVDCVNNMNKETGLNIQTYKAEPMKGTYGLFVPNRPDLNRLNTNTHS